MLFLFLSITMLFISIGQIQTSGRADSSRQIDGLHIVTNMNGDWSVKYSFCYQHVRSIDKFHHTVILETIIKHKSINGIHSFLILTNYCV